MSGMGFGLILPGFPFVALKLGASSGPATTILGPAQWACLERQLCQPAEWRIAFSYPALDRIELPSLRKRLTRVNHLRVTNRDAASMFSMNIPNWKSQAFIEENYAAEEIKQLERNLKRIAEEDSDESEIEWGLRQIAWESAATR